MHQFTFDVAIRNDDQRNIVFFFLLVSDNPSVPPTAQRCYFLSLFLVNAPIALLLLLRSLPHIKAAKECGLSPSLVNHYSGSPFF